MNNYGEQANQRRQEEQVKELDQRLNEIENLVFAHSKEKLDPYTKSILIAHLADNQFNADDIKAYLGVKISQIKTHNYSGLSPMTAFMLRWGWFLGALPMMLLLLIAWWLVDVRNKYDVVEQKSLEQEAIEKVVKYDKTENHYYIDAKDYTVENGKNGGFKGIIIKSKSNESNN